MGLLLVNRELKKAVWGIAGGFLLLVGSLTAKGQAKHPNIIYILADDLGYGDLSCLNKDSRLNTVHLDELAKEGMRFTDAHSNSAVCTPTRYGILTGRYAWRSRLKSGVLWSYDTLLIEKGRTTLASLLKRKGYHTACIGKWHLGLGWQKGPDGKVDFTRKITEGPNQTGFDYFYGITASLDIPPYFYIENDRITATAIDSIKGTKGQGFWRAGPIGNDFKHEEVLPRLTEKAIEYIQQQSRSGSPFFLYLALSSPHTPILPTAAYRGKSHTNAYGDFVLMTDDMVGRVLKAVNDAGIGQNTMIVFASDNGVSPAANLKELAGFGHYSSYIFRGEKSDIFEGGHRIPFIIKWPGKVKTGSENHSTVCLTDFMATLADMMQVKLKDNEGEDSYSLMPLLLQKGEYKRTSIVHHSIDGNFSIRQGDWKLEFCAGSGGWSNPTEKEAKAMNLPVIQLYNLKNDIGEKQNLYNQYPAIVKRLTQLMRSILENGRSTTGQREKNEGEFPARVIQWLSDQP